MRLPVNFLTALATLGAGNPIPDIDSTSDLSSGDRLNWEREGEGERGEGGEGGRERGREGGREGGWEGGRGRESFYTQ